MPSQKITVACSQCEQLRPLMPHLYYDGYLCPTCNREKRKAETRQRNAENAQEIKAKRRAAIYVDRECPLCHKVRAVKKYQDPDCLCSTCSTRKMGKNNTLPYKKETKPRKKRKPTPKISKPKKKKIIKKSKEETITAKAKVIKAREKLRTRVDVNAPLFKRTAMSRDYTDEESAMINDFIEKRGVSVIEPSLPEALDQTGNEVYIAEHYL